MASGPEKASRVGTARRCGLVEQGQKVQRERTSAGSSVTAKPAPTWRIWAGLQCTNSPVVESTPKPFSSIGGEVTAKACGVTVAIGPEILVNGATLNVVYSAGAYFLPNGYKLGTLSVPKNADLLDPQTLVNAKQPNPLFTAIR